MIVKVKHDIVSDGELLAKTGDSGIVIRLIGSTKYHVKFDAPLGSKTEAILSIASCDVAEGGIKNLVSRIVSVDEIDMSNFELFKQECDEIKGFVDPVAAMMFSIQGAAISAYIARYKALLKYTGEKLESEVKKNYGVALNKALGTSADKRDAEARQDVTYQQKIDELASIRAASEIVNAAYDYCQNMYFLFKSVYEGERRSSNTNQLNEGRM